MMVDPYRDRRTQGRDKSKQKKNATQFSEKADKQTHALTSSSAK